MLLKYLFIFFMFSIIGWIIELLYRSYIMKRIVNPGFMTGFVVPLYGFGALILDIICTIFTNELILVIITSITSLSLLEFTTGYILLNLFNIRLWDYSNRKFNVCGFICLYFSMIWGLFSLVFYYLIFPWLNNFALIFINNTYCLFSLKVLIITFILDLFTSIDFLKN